MMTSRAGRLLGHGSTRSSSVSSTTVLVADGGAIFSMVRTTLDLGVRISTPAVPRSIEPGSPLPTEGLPHCEPRVLYSRQPRVAVLSPNLVPLEGIDGRDNLSTGTQTCELQGDPDMHGLPARVDSKEIGKSHVLRIAGSIQVLGCVWQGKCVN